MKGVSLFPNDNKTQLLVAVDPLLFEGFFDIASFSSFVETSPYRHFVLSKDSILSLSDEVMLATSEGQNEIIEKVIGSIEQANIEIKVADDKMSAVLSFTKKSDSGIPDINTLLAQIKDKGIVKGVSRKRVRRFLQSAIDSDIGASISEVIAKGLRPRNGKDSSVKPLVPNALERVLSPKKLGDDKVDMRDLGDILCVVAGTIVAKRMPPTKGRSGMTVTGETLLSTPGKIKSIRLGANTALSQKDESVIFATIDGQAKFDNGIMFVDDAFTAEKGVNVGTGNIKYGGSVIVKGDVTENMEIIAKGDITINGFVESAYIRSGGDIIITEGATGKMHDEDCQLIAGGNIFIQHAQGLDIVAGKNVNVAKQLAYSRVRAKGSITVGSNDHPMGNLFASTIHCSATVQAGTIGAVSGSAMMINFSDGYNLLCSRSDALNELLKQLSTNNANHEIKVSEIQSAHIPAALKAKLAALNNEVEAERLLLVWLRGAQEELEAAKLEFETKARVIANKELFPGVSIKLNKKIWRGEREHKRCRVIFEDGKWLHDPMV